MISRLREHLGGAGLVLAAVALIVALGGGAMAATGGSGGGSGGEATASAKGPRGKQGKTGKTGKTGPAGPAGPAGATGPTGAKGDAGAAGSSGTPGTSATTESFAGAAHGCTEGGVVVKSASPEAIVCNGKKGTDGTTGFTKVLPPGETETGTWWFQGNGGLFQAAPISFSIPLSPVAAAETDEVIFMNPGDTNPECPGTLKDPKAAEGILCIYNGKESSVAAPPTTVYRPDFEEPGVEEESGVPGTGVGTSGVLLYYDSGYNNASFQGGSFAITSP